MSDFVDGEVWHRCSTTYGVLVEGMELGEWHRAVSSAEIIELRIVRVEIFLIIACIRYAATMEVIL